MIESKFNSLAKDHLLNSSDSERILRELFKVRNGAEKELFRLFKVVTEQETKLSEIGEMEIEMKKLKTIHQAETEDLIMEHQKEINQLKKALNETMVKLQEYEQQRESSESSQSVEKKDE